MIHWWYQQTSQWGKMADFTKTISVSFNLLGGGEATKWGAATWGTDVWGEGSQGLEQIVEKGIASPIALTSSMEFYFFIGITNSLSLASDATVLELKSGNYNYVFPGGGKDVNNAIDTTFTTSTPSDPGYSTVSFTTTTWS